MPESRTYTIGADVSCSDGPWGECSRIVIDPRAWKVTHLVVEPHHRHALARIAPVTLLVASGDHIDLRCRRDQINDLEEAAEIEFLPYDPWTGIGTGSGPMAGPYPAYAPVVIVHDRVPEGKAEIGHGDAIQASDGPIGRVRGVVVDARTQRVTHFVVALGHLWTAKDVAIPIAAGDRLEQDGPHTALTKHDVHVLPAVARDERSAQR